MLGHAMFFMWPRVLDDWLGDRIGHKWWQEGGSTFFYRCSEGFCLGLVLSNSFGRILLFRFLIYREFMPQYYKSVFQLDAVDDDQVKGNWTC